MTANHAHTPSTEHVRFIYSLDGADREYKAQEFDRWHAAEIAAAEQRGAKSALLRAEKLLEEDRTELGEEVGVDVILRWLRYLATGSTDRRSDDLEIELPEDDDD